VLSDRERPYEQVVLLDVRGDGRQQFTVDGYAVDGSNSRLRHVVVAPKCQRVQQGRFAGATGSHQSQQFAWSRRTAHCNRQHIIIINLTTQYIIQ